MITGLEPGSPAAKTDLAEGDVIVEAGGRPIATIDDLHKLLTDEQVGVTLSVIVIRRTEKLTFELAPVESRAAWQAHARFHSVIRYRTPARGGQRRGTTLDAPRA